MIPATLENTIALVFIGSFELSYSAAQAQVVRDAIPTAQCSERLVAVFL